MIQGRTKTYAEFALLRIHSLIDCAHEELPPTPTPDPAPAANL